MTNMDVTVLGHALTDITVSCDEDFLKRHKIPKGSMRLIEAAEIQELHDLLPGQMTVTPGGSGCNSAVAMSELGLKVSFMGIVARDDAGARFTRSLDNAGVLLFPEEPLETDGMSGLSIILVTPDGERSMNTCLGVSGQLDARHLDKGTISRSRWLFVEGYLLDNPQCDDLLMAAFSAGAEKVALSLSDSLCVSRNRLRFMELAKNHTDLLFGNEAEMKALFGKSSISYISRQLADWPGIAVMTRSARPAWILRGNSIMKVETRKISRVTDATGAGDHFAAGFFKGLSDSRPLRECAEFGHACAADVTGRRGGR